MGDIVFGEGTFGEGEPGGTPIGPSDILKQLENAVVRLEPSEQHCELVGSAQVAKLEPSESVVEVRSA